MSARRLGQFSVLLIIVVLGAWLLGQPGALQPEGVARQSALRMALAPAGSGTGQTSGDAVPGQTVVYDPVTPVTVDFSNVEIHTDETDSMYYRWLNGEIDLDSEATIISEAEMAARRLLAQQLEPQPQVQQATSGPSLAAPFPGAGFEAIGYSVGNGGSVPPDPELAVGPEHMIAAVNIAVAIYDKSGTTLRGPWHAANFFSQAACHSGLYDPNVLYDEKADRWFIAFDKGPQSSSGGYCVLASQSGDPLGLWNEYFFPLNDSSAWLDYPHAGVGENYIFMGGNMFSGTTFIEGRVFAFRKSELYDNSGGAASLIQRGLGSSHSTPQPLNLHGQSTNTWPSYGDSHYFLTDPFNGQTYAVVRWNPASDSLSTTGTVDLGSYGFPLLVPQRDGSSDGKDLQANDYRPLDFEYRNGYGWTTMTVACNPGSGFNDPVNCVRYAQIDLSNATLGPAGMGVYGSPGDHRFFPDLAVNHCDEMAIGYTKSSSDIYPGIWVSGRRASDPGGALQAEVQLKAGEVAYDSFDSRPYRWGDYTGMTIDPDGATFWYLGQYSKNTGSSARWGTYAGSFSFGGCNGVWPEGNQRTFLPLIAVEEQVPPVVPLQNGDFEQGQTAWNEFSSRGFQLIIEKEEGDGVPVQPRSGDWLVWLGGSDNEISVLAQTATVPDDDPTLRFWHWIGSADDCGFDFGGVVISREGQSTTADIFDLCQETSTDGWELHTVDLSAYGGQTVEIQLRAETDGTNNSNLFIDDVSLGVAQSQSAEGGADATSAVRPERSKEDSGLGALAVERQSTLQRIWPANGDK